MESKHNGVKTVFLCGIGGYGMGYVNVALHPENAPDGVPAFKLIGAADPYAEASPKYAELIAAGVPVYRDASEFFQANTADLCIISSPIQYHLEQAELAIKHGCDVLCEKPIAATLEQARAMKKLADASEHFIGIGFQWSYASEFKRVKRDILAGNYGKPEFMRSMTLWPRDFGYYARRWAGKICDEAGRPVYDSIANNATAHHLHIMLFELGKQMNLSAEVASVECQLYRANNIQNFDTAFLHVTTKSGVPLYYFATHTGQQNFEPRLEFKFTNGDVNTGIGDKPTDVTARIANSTVFASTPDSGTNSKFYEALCAIDGVNGIEQGAMTCDVDTALAHMTCIDAISRCGITQIPEACIVNDGKRISVPGMDDLIRRCFEERRLPHVGEAPWVAPTQRVNF